MSDEKCLMYSCLGRTMELGMLYDCRSETIVPGVTLWNNQVLRSNTDIKPRMVTNCKISTEDNLDTKCHSLDVNASLKLSFMAGMVSVEGSGKYLKNKKSSKNEARVVLEYHSVRNFEQLTMEHVAVENIQYPDVLEKDLATHVVTGVEYGADAFFEFHYTAETADECQEVEGMLKIAVSSISNISIDGKADVKLTEDDKTKVTKCECTYYGDIGFPINPTTFEQAVDLYKNIESYLTINKRENGIVGVPKTVHLYPLCALHSKAPKLVHSISDEVTSECGKIIESWEYLCHETKALQKSPFYATFPAIKAQLEDFCSSVSLIRLRFQSSLLTILPKIRGGALNHSTLTEEIHKYKMSPFDEARLKLWIDSKAQEKSSLESIRFHLNSISDLEFIQSDLSKLPIDSDVLCYSLGKDVSSVTHSFLKELKCFIKHGTKSEDNDDEKIEPWEPADEWYESEEIQYALQQLLQFKTFAQNNKGQKFAVIAKSTANKSKRMGDLLIYKSGKLSPFELPSQPAPPQLKSAEHDSLTISWVPPEKGSKHIVSYVVSYRAKDDTKEQTKGTKETQIELHHLQPNTPYDVCVAAVCEIGKGIASTPATVTTKTPPPLISHYMDQCTVIKEGDNTHPRWLQLQPNDKKVIHETNRLYLEVYGKKPLKYHETKTVLLIGGSGDGKTTLLNGMVNFIYGVRMEDPFRLTLVPPGSEQSAKKSNEAYSQTSKITAYMFHWHKCSQFHYNIMIIDTPGLDDTDGFERQMEIKEQIRLFFQSEMITHLDCVGFVCKASTTRLSYDRKYLIQAVLDVFGKDLSENITLLLTFSDGTKPAAVNTLKENNVPFHAYFQFNSSVFTVQSETDNTTYPFYWEMAFASAKSFFNELGKLKPKSLQLTQENLRIRKQIEVKLLSVQERVQNGVNVLAQMEEELQIIKIYVAEKSANKDFKRKIIVPKTRRVPKPTGSYTTVCLVCSQTCHKECSIPDDGLKYQCAAMKNQSDPETCCTVCKNKCSWKEHKNLDYYYEEYQVEEEISIADLEKKYNAAAADVDAKRRLIHNFFDAFDATQKALLDDIDLIRDLLGELNSKALRYNPMTTVEYLQKMIDQLRDEKGRDYNSKIMQLEAALKRSKMIVDLNQKEEYNPFKERREAILKEIDSVEKLSSKADVEPKTSETKSGILNWCASKIKQLSN